MNERTVLSARQTHHRSSKFMSIDTGVVRDGCVNALLRRAIGAVGRPSAWLGMVLALDAAIAVAGISVAHGSGLLGLLAACPLLACHSATAARRIRRRGFCLSLSVGDQAGIDRR